MKGFCEICKTEIEIKYCCSGHECGCMGLPIDPPVCSDKCYNEFMNNINLYNIKKEENIEENIEENPDLPF